MPNQNSKQPDPIQVKRMAQHRVAVEKARVLALRKNTEYGDAISRSGIAGCAIELNGISGRVWELTKHAMAEGLTPEIREQLTDKALDAINYGAWLLAFLEDGNLAGQ